MIREDAAAETMHNNIKLFSQTSLVALRASSSHFALSYLAIPKKFGMVKRVFWPYHRRQFFLQMAIPIKKVSATPEVANPPGMGGRIPEFHSISRLPPNVAREIVISQNALILMLYNGSILAY